MKRAKKPAGAGKRTAFEHNDRLVAGTASGGVDKLKTEIAGFDEMLEGGIPRGRSLIISGSTGSGKTVFLNEFLYRGITRAGENGIFVTIEERPDDIIRNVRSFGWDYRRLIKQGRLAFVDASPADEVLHEIGPDYDLTPLLMRIRHAVEKVKAKRIAIDCLDSLFARFSNKDAIRSVIYLISDELKKMGITCMITAEKPDGDSGLSRHGVAEFVADGVLDLAIKSGQQQFIRTMFVRKLRGTGYRSGAVEFEITKDGLRVFPKISIDRRYAVTSFSTRRRFGIPGLDRALGGGIPQGHIMLISGNTGTGKTLCCLQFLKEGIEKGERGVYVSLEEPVSQINKTTNEHGWDFAGYEKRGDLSFVSPSLIDIGFDKLLCDILNAVVAMDAKRVVVDSMSSLESATMNREQVRQFLIQLTAFLKSRGITCVMSYLVGMMLGSSKGQLLTGIETNEMRLSSVVDGIILLRYVERGQKIRRLLNVLKLRGSGHSKDIFQFTIEQGGVVLGEKYEE